MKTNTDAVLSAKSLRYFLQLIDSMSYTQAAQILGITQPALTQQIKKLERAVGSPLFGQMGKKLYLTDAGLKMEETAKALFSTVNNAVDSIQQYTKSDTGAISLGILSTVEARVIDQFLIEFNQKYPDITLHVGFYNRTELWDKLDNNQLDLAVLYLPDHNATVKNMKQYMAKQIYSESVVFLTHDPEYKFDKMTHHRWVTYPKDYYLPQIVHRFYAGQFVDGKLSTPVTFTSPYQLIKFAEQTDYDTYVSKSFYKAHQAEIALSPVDIKDETNFESCFIYRKNKSEIPRLANFLKEWDKFIDERDYDSRLKNVKVSI